MEQLTIHDVDDDLYAALERAAQQHGISLNQYVVNVLKQAAGMANGASEEQVYHDLDHLAGAWSPEEAEEFNRIIMEARTIDPEMWK